MSMHPNSHKALTLLREDPTRFANQGSVVTSWRTYNSRRLGPYHRLTWRENGRQRSIYLGRQSPLVDEVRRLLHEAQTIRRMIREHRRRQAEFKEHVIRPLQQYIREIVRLFGNGLYLDGWQLRGTRTAGPRLTTADVPEHLIPKFPLPLPSFLAELHASLTNPKRERKQQPPHTYTNPKRKRGQTTPSPNTPSHQQHIPPSIPPYSKVLRTGSLSTDQPPREAHRCNTWPNLAETEPTTPYQDHEYATSRSVDQNRPHTARGPPIDIKTRKALRKKSRPTAAKPPHSGQWLVGTALPPS